jgi:hypothetical protein
MTDQTTATQQVVLPRKRYDDAMRSIEFVVGRLNHLARQPKVDKDWMSQLALQLKYAKDALKP